jgi:hypothetical protein
MDTRMTDMFQSMENRLISLDDRFLTIDQRMQLREADMAQINVRNTLRHILPADQRDEVPWHLFLSSSSYIYIFLIVDKFLDS